MKSLTVCKRVLAFVVFSFMLATSVSAQLSMTNPDQVTVITKGNADISSTHGKQTKHMGETGALALLIGGDFVQIKTWEGKYNGYLKTARGYAEQMKAANTIYLDAVRCFQSILEIQRAIEANPQGIGATVAMNNIYMETLAEFIATFRLLKRSVASGGAKNMLTGAERTELFWSLADRMSALREKLHAMALSIAYYNLGHVWRSAISDFLPVDHKRIAQDALRDWKARHEAAIIISGAK